MADLACWWVLDLTTFVNHFGKVSREETELTNADDTTFITVVNVVKAVNEPFNFSEGCLGSDGDLQNLRNRQSVTFLEGPADDDASLLDSLHWIACQHRATFDQHQIELMLLLSQEFLGYSQFVFCF